MSREILFRGKRIDNGEWVYGGSLLQFASDDSCYIAPSSEIVYTAEDDAGNIIRLASNIAVVIPETVGQYTGLLDKNGTKIFEGDIVKDRWTNGIVTFGKHRIDCCGCCYSYHNTIGFYVDEGKGPICSDEDTWDNFEVIGNIHDNPELMEVQK